MRKLVMVMQGVLSLATLLLFSNTPVFANPDLIELVCKTEEGEILKRSIGSPREVIDDSDREFTIIINQNDYTIEVISETREEDYVNPNVYSGSGDILVDEDTKSSFFHYDESLLHGKINKETNEWISKDGRKRTWIQISLDGEMEFMWSIEYEPHMSDKELRRVNFAYMGKCARKN